MALWMRRGIAFSLANQTDVVLTWVMPGDNAPPATVMLDGAVARVAATQDVSAGLRGAELSEGGPLLAALTLALEEIGARNVELFIAPSRPADDYLIPSEERVLAPPPAVRAPRRPR